MPPGEVAFQKEGMASTKALRRGAVPEHYGCTEATQVVGPALISREPLEPAIRQQICSLLSRACLTAVYRWLRQREHLVSHPRLLGSLRGEPGSAEATSACGGGW